MKMLFVKKIKKHKKEKGFTLVELILTIAILSIIVVPVLSVILTSSRNNANSRELLAASTMGDRAMEEIKTWTVDKLDNNSSGVFYEDDAIKVDYTIALEENYKMPEGLYKTSQAGMLQIEIGDTYFELIDSTGIIGTYDLASTYGIEFYGTSTPYNFSLYEQNTTKTLLKTLPIESVNGVIGVNFKNAPSRTSTSREAVFHAIVSNEVPEGEKICLYIYEDLMGLNIINDGARPINNIYNLNNPNNEKKNHSGFLYKITIIATQKNKEQKELHKIISYLRK